MTSLRYAPSVGQKFYENGRVRQFPGNTIICFADPQGQAYQDAEWVQSQLLQEPYGHKYAMLPPSSFHMTVFELLCDEVRVAEKWSSGLALDASLEETDDYFIETVAQVPSPDNFRMEFSHLNLGTSGLSLYLKPVDDDVEKALCDYRDTLAEATQIRFPDHDSYGFHLSLAYRIIELTEDEKQQEQQFAERMNQQLSETFGVFDTGKPTLTFFDDMFTFLPADKRHTLKSRNL